MAGRAWHAMLEGGGDGDGERAASGERRAASDEDARAEEVRAYRRRWNRGACACTHVAYSTECGEKPLKELGPQRGHGRPPR